MQCEWIWDTGCEREERKRRLETAQMCHVVKKITGTELGTWDWRRSTSVCTGRQASRRADKQTKQGVSGYGLTQSSGCEARARE